MQQYSTFMPGPVAPPQVPNPTYSATTPWGRGKEMEQATNLAATVGNSGINHLINQNQNQKIINSRVTDDWYHEMLLYSRCQINEYTQLVVAMFSS